MDPRCSYVPTFSVMCFKCWCTRCPIIHFAGGAVICNDDIKTLDPYDSHCVHRRHVAAQLAAAIPPGFSVRRGI